MEQESVNFVSYLKKRQEDDERKGGSSPAIKKAYFIGGYAKAVIMSSYKSEVSIQFLEKYSRKYQLVTLR